jgi:hypothetical protein
VTDVNIMPVQRGSSGAGEPREAVRRLLASDEAFATTLLVLAADTYGLDCLYWHPQTLRRELEETFGVGVPKRTFDRLMAAIAVATTDAFYKDVARFVQLANILAGDEFQPDEFDLADPVECAWAITEALIIAPPDLERDPEPFAPDIRRYIAAVLRDGGYNDPPDVLKIALDDFSNPTITDFSDDPEMFQAVFETQQGKSDEVTSVIKENLAKLAAQIKALPLRNGSKDQFLDALRRTLPEVEKPEEPLK